MNREQRIQEICGIVVDCPTSPSCCEMIIKIADYIEAEVKGARTESYRFGYQDGLKENNNVSIFSLGSFFNQNKRGEE